MQEPWNSDSDDVGTTFRDMITLALAGFVCILILVIPFITEKAKQKEGSPEPGNVIVEARWPDEINADVDMWVKAPGDIPVGYSNKSGVIFNLLRDDLGTQADPTKLNYEIAYSRGLPPGEYIVNVHLYRNSVNVYPVKVVVAVSAKSDPKTSAKQIVSTEVELTYEGQEYTALRFKLDEQGNLVKGSLNNLSIPLRSGGK